MDLVVAGTPRVRPELGQVYLAVEVSATIDVTDVDRAADRAAILGRAGIRAVPVACGRGMTEGAREEISTRQVAVLLDGKRMGWDEALATWCPPPAAA